MTVSSVIKLSDIESYSSIKKNLEGKKCSLQFLPVSLETISKQKNFIYKGQKLKSSYALDIVHNLILKYYFKKDNRFHLMSTILKEKYGHLYNYYMDYLNLGINFNKDNKITVDGSEIEREDLIAFVKDFAAGKSRRASMRSTCISGTSTRTLASAGRIFTLCCSKPSAGKTSALAPSVFVSNNTVAIVGFPIPCKCATILL